MKTLLVVQAAGSLVLSAVNATYFLLYARRAQLRPRRVGAFSLALLQAAMLLEAMLFLFISRYHGQSEDWEPAQLIVRSFLLLAVALVSLLIALGSGLPRR